MIFGYHRVTNVDVNANSHAVRKSKHDVIPNAHTESGRERDLTTPSITTTVIEMATCSSWRTRLCRPCLTASVASADATDAVRQGLHRRVRHEEQVAISITVVVILGVVRSLSRPLSVCAFGMTSCFDLRTA